MTPGHKTSEHKALWATILISVAASLGAIAAIPAMPVAIVIAATVAGAGVASAGYSMSRGLVKSSAEIVEKTSGATSSPPPKP